MATGTEQNPETCANCGADVRENTAFCYKCGTRVSVPTEEVEPPEPVDEAGVDERARTALDDLAERLRKDEAEDKQLAKAASERRKARIAQRKPKEPTWEPDDGAPALMLLLVTAGILVVAALVVYFTAIAK
jgi:uncharacterized Zn finger protein (UPF0148 family)